MSSRPSPTALLQPLKSWLDAPPTSCEGCSWFRAERRSTEDFQSCTYNGQVGLCSSSLGFNLEMSGITAESFIGIGPSLGGMMRSIIRMCLAGTTAFFVIC